MGGFDELTYLACNKEKEDITYLAQRALRLISFQVSSITIIIGLTPAPL